MIKSLFIFVFICICNSTIAQIWVKPNATWHFDFQNTFTDGFVKIQYIKDTILDSKASKMFISKKYEFVTDQNNISHFLDSNIIDSNYTWNNGDTVYYWTSNHFEILYDFSKTIGESWIINIEPLNSNNCNDTSKVIVSNNYNENFNGIAYQTLDLHSSSEYTTQLTGKYNSRFGPYSNTENYNNLIFPLKSGSCDSTIAIEFPVYTFKCYQDDSLYYNPSDTDCEYLLTHLGIPESSNSLLNIYPNPSFGEIVIETKYNESHLNIYNMQGKLCKMYELKGINNRISLEVEKGNYILEIIQNQEKTLKHLVLQ
ncbi:MAG: T9SS type A sorting domain-containing protein [Flavobacteriia bacterium]|nr:T9SS type A sorting domain-containing protein [Flavobacteriia bacterium]